MPTPLEILLDPISLIILAIYGGLMLWEALFPEDNCLKLNTGGLKVCSPLFATSFFPLICRCSSIHIWKNTSCLTGRRLGTVWGGLVAVLLYEFGVFVWHYCLHRSDFLWKTFHQMHHSAERLDTYGAFFFSPFDMIGWTILGSICFSLIAGLSPQAITIMLLVTNFFSIFQHANIKTPRWLGYIVQRPESHTYHHAQGIHRFNYSDLPLFDIIFGTFRNPKDFEHETGFYNGASVRIWDMLRAKDITTPKIK